MKENQLNTPPSSMQGDEIAEDIPTEVMEEMEFDDDEELVEVEEFLSEEEGDLAPPEDLAAVVFDKHVGSVFCCDLHPEGKLAATGGEDDKTYVWSVENGQVMMDCDGHKDSVIFVGFSFDGAYFASADMSGVIKVWKCDQHQETWPIAFEYEVDDITWGLWHYKSRVLIFGTITGNIFVFKIPSGDLKVLQGSNNRVECGKLFPDGVRLAAGYEDGTVKIWDLKANSVLHQLPANSHSTQIVAIDTHPENNLMVSLSNEGKVVLTASLSKKIVNQLEIEDDLEAAAFTQDPELRYLALGTLKGAVRIWDLARQITRHHIQPGDKVAGVTKMVWVNNYLVTGCLDGELRIYEGRSGEQSSLTGHESEVLDFCYNEKEKIILSTSDDGTARIFAFNPK